jgi:hypothetical protein
MITVSYPYTFTNGTTGDGGQVQANFAAINSALAAAIPKGSVTLTPPVTITGFTKGFVLSNSAGLLYEASRSPAKQQAQQEDVENSTIFPFMMGIQSGVSTITPTLTGRALIIICGTMEGNGQLQLYYGFGLGPAAYSSVAVGTEAGALIACVSPSNASLFPFGVAAIINGLVLNQPYWFDLGFIGVPIASLSFAPSVGHPFSTVSLSAVEI